MSRRQTAAARYFARPHARLGSPLMIFGWLYLAGTELRYFLLRSHEVPVLFHIVLAGFLIVYGNYQRRVAASRLYH